MERKGDDEPPDDQQDEIFRQNWQRKEYRLQSEGITVGPDDPIAHPDDFDPYIHEMSRLNMQPKFPVTAEEKHLNLKVWDPRLKRMMKQMKEKKRYQLKLELLKRMRWKNRRIRAFYSRPFVYQHYLVITCRFVGDDKYYMIEFDPAWSLDDQCGTRIMSWVQVGIETQKMTKKDYLCLCAKCPIFETRKVRDFLSCNV